jgi:hypothetical protein
MTNTASLDDKPEAEDLPEALRNLVKEIRVWLHGQRVKSPYLKPGRLQDILAAIQTMAIYRKYRRSAGEWARLISGNKTKSVHWIEIFNDHPEFFRPSETYPGFYALVWRRATDDRFHTGLGRVLLPAEIALLSIRDRKRYLTRAPVPEVHIKTLMDAAIDLHQRAVDEYRDRRWWITPVIGLIATTVGAFIGAIAGARFK